MAYQASNPGPAVEISSAESGTTYRGFQTLVETTITFVSDGNAIGPITIPAFTVLPIQVDSITAITGTIAAFTQEPNAGHAG